MTSVTLLPGEMIREAYYHSDYYQSEKIGDNPPQYNKEALFVDEDASRRVDGQVESSSGEDSYSAEESELEKDNGSEDGNYTTLNTVDAKYLASTAESVCSEATDDNNVIELKEVLPAQPYDLNIQNYYQDNVHNGFDYSAYKPIKYEQTDVPREVLPYSFPYISQDVQKSRETALTPSYGIPSHINTAKIQNDWSFQSANTQQQQQQQQQPSSGGNGSKAAVYLCNRDLWSKFHTHTTEMIVTKQGR